MSENEYKEWVLEAFDQRMVSLLLTAELMSPTPGSLKSESVKICERRFSANDELILRSFFNQKEDAAAYRQAIQNCNADIFRPLVGFLRDRKINTTLKNINLLAWLIDFQPRPYHPNLTRPVKADTLPPELPPFKGESGSEIRPILQRLLKQPLTLKKTRIIGYVSLSILFILTSYFIVDYIIYRPTGLEGCMIWNHDRYQAKDCKERSAHIQLYPINHDRINNFKKIGQPDTLTAYSVGKVWYAKFNGRVEFYTSAGLHPLDTNKRLLVMTDHIYKKYVLHVEN